MVGVNSRVGLDKAKGNVIIRVGQGDAVIAVLRLMCSSKRMCQLNPIRREPAFCMSSIL